MLNLTQIKSSIPQILRRFHIVVFVIACLGGLTVATTVLYQASNYRDPDLDSSPNLNSSAKSQFEAAESRQNSLDLDSIKGRVNPFD